jgi:hypothetical protein
MLITGIDKVHLQTESFDTSKAQMNTTVSNLWVDSINQQTGEVIKEQVISEKEFLNDAPTGIHVSKNKYGVLLQFNPNRVLTNTHHEVRPQNEFMESVEKVSNLLKDKHNVELDLVGAKLTHLDLCRNAILNYPLQAYMPAFSMLDASRLNNVQHENGFYWKSENNIAVAYDKAYQVRKVFKVKGLPLTLARLEIRHTSEGLKQKSFRINSIDGLAKIDVAKSYNQFLTNRVFKQGKQLSIHPATSILDTYLKSSNYNAVGRFINDMIIGSGGATSKMEALIDAYGSIDAFRHECSMLGVTRQRWKAFIARFQEDDAFYQRVVVKKGILPVDLIHEIRTKFELVA